VAFRAGAHWLVAIEDGSAATFERRQAAAALVFQSLRPKGYVRESFAGRTPHTLDASRIAALQAFVESSMRALDVPGVGLALIDHGKIVYEGGFGVRDLGKPAPVDAHTLFMIASNTKGLSTLLLARLADQGKLRWDQPVTQLYPGFRLGDLATTRSVLMKHLVCACTGLPRKDDEIIFHTTAATPASETFTLLAQTQPTSTFGEVFQYNNLMAAAAGYIGGHLVHPAWELGAAYDAAMQEQIFGPLGMNETTFDMQRALAGNHASPHADDIDGVPHAGSNACNTVFEPFRPAGGAWSSAHDMIKYVQDELTEGRLPDGTRFVSAKNLLQRRVPFVPVGEDASYGMGLLIDTQWGVTVIHHGGSVAGYRSDVLAIPSAQVGAVILTNGEYGNAMLRPFMRRVLELLFDGQPEAAADVTATAARIKAEMHEDRKTLVVPPAPALARELAASYDNPSLGHIAVIQNGTGILFDFGAWRSRVASRRDPDGTVSFITIDPLTQGFSFIAGRQDGIAVLTIRDGQHKYTYRARPYEILPKP
jgi:CubicO group peptidase (beta-lactamase class C family)